VSNETSLDAVPPAWLPVSAPVSAQGPLEVVVASCVVVVASPVLTLLLSLPHAARSAPDATTIANNATDRGVRRIATG
jgi:hypothetical protein